MDKNPLLPVGYDIFWAVVVAVQLVVLVLALVSIARTRRLGATAQAVWVLIVLLIPILGSLTWFILGRRTPAVGGSPSNP